MLSLAQPLWLILLPLPLMFWHWARRRQTKTDTTPTLLHPHAALLNELQQQLSPKSDLPWFWLIGCLLIISALSQPQWQSKETQARNFMLAIDVSGSMRAMDFTHNGQVISRLDMLKQVVTDFIEQRQNDRIGLIVFADDAYTLSPLTTDSRLLKQFLIQIKNGMAGEKTALGQAIALGVKRLQHQAVGSRALILLTDGTQSAGDITPEQALHIAQDYQVRIYTIGIGTHGKVFFPRGPMEKPDYKEVPLDEASLHWLAEQSGGRYYRATATNELAQIIHDVEQVETATINNQQQSAAQEWYWLPLLVGLVLVSLSLLLGQQRVRP